MDESTQVVTVTELTRQIKASLESEFTQVWVEGEMSNFVLHSSGHMYFTLKDADSQIQGVMFRNANRVLSFDVHNGMKVIVCGRVSVYEKRGNYQLYVDRLEPKGIGPLQLAFEQLKEKLFKEGLFDEQYKQKLPVFPRTIGIVTSPTGAAIRDILQIIDRRFGSLHILLNPVNVQGAGAAEEIARAIDEFNEYGTCDVLIVGRGGGSLEDLWAFNEEIVARAIFRSKIPVISAVGHEIDYTISDFVSDVRAATPSAAAELVIKEKSEWLAHIEASSESLTRSMKERIAAYRQSLSALETRAVFRRPHVLLQEYAQRIDDYARHLSKSLQLVLEQKKSLFREYVAKLEGLSPLSILARGYSITYKEGSIENLIDSSDVKKDDLLVTRLHCGLIHSRVV